MADCKAIVSYLAAFKADNSLYEDPTFAMGLLRILNPDVRRLVFTLLVSSVHIPRLEKIQNIKESIEIVIQIRIAIKANDMLNLNDKFRTALLRGFCLGSVDFSIFQCDTNSTLSSEPAGIHPGNKVAPSSCSIQGRRNSLDEVARELSNIKFQRLLQSVVGNDTGLMYGVRDVLIFCNLIDPMYQITRKGFEFLLNNRANQHWIIILSSIKYFATGMNRESEMFLQLMEMCVKDKPGLFSVGNWTNWHSFLNSVGVLHLVSLSKDHKGKNLVTFRESTGRMVISTEIFNAIESIETETKNLDPSFSYFYLNTACLSDFIKPLKLNSQKFIFLETNFKIYAYTNKDYEKSILSLFSRTIYTLPNLVKAQLDEESVVSAYFKGITAKQILKYLREFAHTVPSSVSNQIVIWENRQHRVAATNGILYMDFLHMSDYLQVLRFLERKNAVLLKDESKRIIVGTEETHAQVKEMLDNL